MKGALALFDQVRRWLWLLALIVGLAGAWRIFVSGPRVERAIAEASGAAAQRIEEVTSAAARGDDTEVQRRHAEAVERAEQLLGRR
jgi:hypothetical protein